jgi:hypothetical protein
LFTLRISGTVLSSCVHPGITVIDACPVALSISDLTFNADGSISAVARPPSTEVSVIHVARAGGTWVYLRSSPTNAGLARFRIGLPLQPVLGATAAIGDTRGNYGQVTVTPAEVTFAGVGPTGIANFGIGSFPNVVFGSDWPPGLFIYSETGVDQYFIGQSAELVVVNGARNLSNPFVNGYLAIGLRP